MTRGSLSKVINELGAQEGRFTTVLKKKIGSSDETWYEHQKEHWQGWLREYAGPGFYCRKNGQRDAAFVYTHIQCSPMLMWLAEALGVQHARLMRAMVAAAAARSSGAAQCAAFREEIPWSLLEKAIRRRPMLLGRAK